MTWTDELSVRFEKDFDALAVQVQRAIDQKLGQLAENPYALDIKKLRGVVDRWRVRVGDHRIIVRLDEAKNVVVVLRVRHRREDYR